MSAISFDASIGLTVDMVPADSPPTATVDRVRSAIEALPGAAWISVAWFGWPPTAARWLRLFRPGDAREREDANFVLVRAQIAAVVLNILEA